MLKFLISVSLLIGILKLPTYAGAWTIDSTSQDWTIEVTLKEEKDRIPHKVDTILIDDDTQEVVILYPGDSRGVKYAFDKIDKVYFHNPNKKITNIKSF